MYLSEILNLKDINIISLSIIFYACDIYIIACVKLNCFDKRLG